MEKIKLESGLEAVVLTDSERKILWEELMTDVNPIGKHSLFTPQDNLEYFIISETEISYDNYIAVIKANQKEFTVKYGICNQDVKINQAVRRAYK